MMIELNELMSAVEDKLKQGSYTVQEMCHQLNIDDDFEVLRVLARLEITEKSKTDGYKQSFNPDGSSVLMAKYTHI